MTFLNCLDRLKLTKAEKSQRLAEKTKNAPKGGTLAGQVQKVQTVRKYAGKKK